MPVNKVRRNGSFAPLSAQAYKDDALMEAGEAAELLFYRGLSFGADVLRDGFMSESQLVRVVGHGMKDALKRADRLVTVGLWRREEGGYLVKSWLKWNRSRAEIEELQTKDTGRKGGRPSTPNGDTPPPDEGSERNPNGIQSESEPANTESVDGIRTDSNATHAGLRARPPSLQPQPSLQPSSEADASGAPRRKRARRRLAEDWEPNGNCREYASANDLDVAHEAEQFRAHAEANDRQQVDWDAAFRTWLGNCRKWDRPRAPEPSVMDGFQLPAAPKSVMDDPDSGAYVRWARAQRDEWLAAQGRPA